MYLRCIFVMGVAGCGKTTIGQELAAKIGANFKDADDLHSEENRRKMAIGNPLTDEDRLPWLEQIANYAKDATGRVVIACSALRANYRKILVRHLGNDFAFIHLVVAREVARLRVENRRGHFVSPKILDDQYNVLEVPENEKSCYNIDGNRSPTEIVNDAIKTLELECVI